jgi:hypothetical protein
MTTSFLQRKKEEDGPRRERIATSLWGKKKEIDGLWRRMMATSKIPTRRRMSMAKQLAAHCVS